MRPAVIALSLCLHAALVGVAVGTWPTAAAGEREPARFGLELREPAPPPQAESEPPPPVFAEPLEENLLPEPPPVAIPEPPSEPPAWSPLPERAAPRLLPVLPPRPAAPVTAAPPVEVMAPPVEPGAAYVAAVPLPKVNRAPEYPERARRLGQEGEVRVGVRVGLDGSAAEVWLAVACPHPDLNRAALAAVRGFRFQPATRGGVPEAGELVVPVVFRLRDR